MESTNHISAKLLAYSYNEKSGQELMTYECELPRIILAELSTHRGHIIFNSQSSRAVPVDKYLNNIKKRPFFPIFWGKKQKGMAAFEEQSNAVPWLAQEGPVEIDRDDFWEATIYHNLSIAYAMDKAGYHKQIVNRIIENYSYVRIVLSATNLDNFFHQRIHKMAEPHIRDLAIKMYEEKEKMSPRPLTQGEWHLPYIRVRRGKDNKLEYYRVGDEKYEHPLTLSAAQQISVVCCAQVSYRNLNDSFESVNRVYANLISDDPNEPGHYSPFCHQGTPMDEYHLNQTNPKMKGISHVSINGDFYSGQFKHWIQLRKTMANECFNGFTPEIFETRKETF